MSIARKIGEAREYITLLLRQFEEGGPPTEVYSQERIRDRKINWHCIKSSKILSKIPGTSFPNQVESEIEQTQTHSLRLQLQRAMENDDDVPVRSTTSLPVPFNAASIMPTTNHIQQRDVHKTMLVAQQGRPVVEERDVYDPVGGSDRLLMSGFAEVKSLLQKKDVDSPSGRQRTPYVSLGELGIAEGWTTSVTNAAYCYDHNPAEGWRREVSIRMSGKSRGSIDIHYVTPDKTRRFRSRQDLQSYLTKINASSNFINAFDFRTLFCLCHDNEDPSRSFVECSYGLAGCNKWLHPECIGLGRRTDKELELMPKVICPYCAAYLKGTGELEAYVTPDMLVMTEMPASIAESSEEADEGEIEESAVPHVLWGLQGSQYVYCSVSNASGMDALDEAFDIPANPSISASNSSNGTNRQQVGQRKGSSSSSTSSQVALSQQAPPPQQDSTAAELAGTFLQHRLFQGGWMSGSSSADAEGSASGTAAPTTFSLKEEEEEEEVIPSDDDGGVPSNKDHLEPGERVRRARHPDGSTTMVRVEGGWMVRKKQKVDHYPGGASASATDISATAAAYAETAHPAGASAEETAMSLAEEEDRMQRVLAKAAEKGEAPFVSVSVRYKNEAIEAAVNAVQSSSHRRKPTFSASALSSIASSSGIASPSAANGAAGETAAAELREAYRINPSLCYLPMEDGGIRFTSVSFAPVPRSLHPLCAANLMCGYCMTVTPPKSSTIACALRDAVGAGDDNAVGVRGGAKSSSKKSKKSSTPWVAPEVDRYALTSKAYGAVTYRVHKQCTDANASDVLQQELQHLAAFNGDSGADGASNISETLPVVTLGEVYEYEQAEDAECDLCGRKGGVLQYFHIHASRSSILPPTEDGWLAHIPCLHFLHSSNLLRRIDGSGGSAVSSAAVADTSDAAAVGQQALSGGSNPFSNCVGADSYATAQPSESTLLGNSVENREGARLEEGGADAVEEVDDAVKERLQQENRLHPRPPLSLFDQLFGHWRCAICGLQCGLAVRCVSAACAVRVHPLCATALNSPNWQICSVETAEGDVVEKEGQSSMCVLCPLHSAGLSKSKVV